MKKRLYGDDKRRRDIAVLADVCAGMRIRDVAEKHNIAPRYVQRISSAHNLSRPHGRPRIAPEATDAERQRYRKLSSIHGAPLAREIMGWAPRGSGSATQ